MNENRAYVSQIFSTENGRWQFFVVGEKFCLYDQYGLSCGDFNSLKEMDYWIREEERKEVNNIAETDNA